VLRGLLSYAVAVISVWIAVVVTLRLGSAMRHTPTIFFCAVMLSSWFGGLLPGIFLGLAISRSIIEAHDGQLTAATSDGAGAVFRFTLPAEEGGRVSNRENQSFSSLMTIPRSERHWMD
jgi:light-regulated signal transduction histidine kinase (bacteriophytochrome)